MIAPLFLLLLGGIIEFGQAFRIQHSLSAAARHGARAAVIDGATSADVIQKVRNHCATTLGVAQSNVSVAIAVNGQPNGNVATAERGDAISVSVNVAYSQVGVGFFTRLFTSSTLSSHCTFERE
jgi:Flp pilus assembly protein TadG